MNLDTFSTPQKVVQRMLELAKLQKGEILLDPSAGDGAILSQFPAKQPYMAVENNPVKCKVLKGKGISVRVGDFLTMEKIKADVVIMAPPLSVSQGFEHIIHAWEIVSAGGRVVSLVDVNTLKLLENWLVNRPHRSYRLSSTLWKESKGLFQILVIKK